MLVAGEIFKHGTGKRIMCYNDVDLLIQNEVLYSITN